MSRVNEYLTKESKGNIQFGTVKFNESETKLINKVYEYRVENGFSGSKMEFLQQCVKTAMLCGKPTEYVPQFRLPDMDALITEIEDPGIENIIEPVVKDIEDKKS